MKASFKRSALIDALQRVSRFAAKRSTIEALRFTRLEAGGNAAGLLATDQDASCSAAIDDVEVRLAGAVLIDTERAIPILKSLRQSEVSIYQESGRVVIQEGKSVFRLASPDATTFPVSSLKPLESHYQIDYRALASLVNRTHHATDEDSPRYTFSSIQLEFGDEMLTGMASDGRRVAIASAPACKCGDVSSAQHLPPAGALLKALRSLPEGQLRIGIVGNDVVIAAESMECRIRMCEGRMPRLRDAVPRSSDSRFVAMTSDILGLVDRVALLRGTEVYEDTSGKKESLKARGATFAFSPGELEVSYKSEEGDFCDAVPVAFDGKPVSFLANYQFIQQAIRAIADCSEFYLDPNDGKSAITISTTCGGYQTAIMPMAKDLST